LGNGRGGEERFERLGKGVETLAVSNKAHHNGRRPKIRELSETGHHPVGDEKHRGQKIEKKKNFLVPAEGRGSRKHGGKTVRAFGAQTKARATAVKEGWL